MSKDTLIVTYYCEVNPHKCCNSVCISERKFHKVASMRLLSENGTAELHLNAKEEDLPWKLEEYAVKLSEEGGGGGGTTSSTNVIWVQNPWTQLTNTDNRTEMPAATIGSTQHPNNEECGIRDVWAHNLEDEFRTIRQIVQKYPYVAMDTEFPGVVARPIGEFRSTAEYQYQLLRCNVDLLRIIQLGLTFLDENGKTPGGSYTTWQFNFKFNLNEDMYAQDSIELLQNSGIQFKKHEDDGIEPSEFAELLMTSGIVLMDNIKWLSFHSGYDFGYLIKLLTDTNLPMDESDFFELLKLYFPTIYDVKYLMKSCKNLKGGLQEVAEQLDLERIGPQHQAGSDSLLTGMAFFKMKEVSIVQENGEVTLENCHRYVIHVDCHVTRAMQEKYVTSVAPLITGESYVS